MQDKLRAVRQEIETLERSEQRKLEAQKQHSLDKIRNEVSSEDFHRRAKLVHCPCCKQSELISNNIFNFIKLMLGYAMGLLHCQYFFADIFHLQIQIYIYLV